MLPVDTIVCAKGKQRSHHISQPAKAEALFKILPNFVLDLFSGPEGRTSLPLALFFALLLASASAAAALEKQHSSVFFFGAIFRSEALTSVQLNYVPPALTYIYCIHFVIYLQYAKCKKSLLKLRQNIIRFCWGLFDVARSFRLSGLSHKLKASKTET